MASSIAAKFSLKGRGYVVTGGAMGIGKPMALQVESDWTDNFAGFSIAKDIAESGGDVAVIDLRDSPLEDVYGLAKQYGVKTSYHQADVSNEVSSAHDAIPAILSDRSLQASLTSAFEKAVESLGKVDGIVTAAGIAIDKPFIDQKWEEVEKVLQVNVRSAECPLE